MSPRKKTEKSEAEKIHKTPKVSKTQSETLGQRAKAKKLDRPEFHSPGHPPREVSREELRKLSETPLILPPSAAEQRALKEQLDLADQNAEQAKENAEANAEATKARAAEVADLTARAAEAEDAIFIDSKRDLPVEVSYGGVSYYISPGANEIKPQVAGHTAEGIAAHILGAVSFVEMRVQKTKKRGAAGDSAEDGEVDPLRALSTFAGLPAHALAGLVGVENPPARERAQPILPPNDTEHYSEDTLDQMKEKWLEGQEGQKDANVKSPRASAKASTKKAPKRSGVARRLAEEK